MGQLTKQFGKINVTLPIPHLLNLQIDSYSKFLQEGVAEADRNKEEGLEGVFHTVFPIEDFNKTASLEFVSYEIREPKYDQAECISKGLTYEAPVHIKVRLVVYDTDEATGNRTIRDIKEQGIYFGTLPLMTEKGTFIINGTERVIVNQLQRSPGIIFEHDGGKTHTSRKVLYSCRVIPMRGSWLDFDFDHKDILYVRIDRRRKMPATILFKAMGMSKMDILEYFYTREHYLLKPHNTLMWEVEKSLYRKDNAYSDIVAEDGTVLIKAGKPITKRGWRQVCEAGIKAIEVRPDTLDGMFLAEDVIAPGSGEVLAEAADEITPGLLERMREKYNIDAYTKGINWTDQETADFLNQLDQMDKPITVIFYGDHLPGIYATADENKNNKTVLHETDYFIWSNSASVSHGAKVDPSTTAYTSSNYFMPLAAEHMNAKVSPYLAMLTDLKQQIPAMSRVIGSNGGIGQGKATYLDQNGNRIKATKVSRKAQRLLEDYKLVQYDQTIGKNYLKNTGFTKVP